MTHVNGQPTRVLAVLVVFVGLSNCLVGCGDGTAADARFRPQSSGTSHLASEAGNSAVAYLAEEMDRFHTKFDVYTDADAPGNHFPVLARFASSGDEDAIPPMVENYPDDHDPSSGLTCIKASFKAKGNNWGGWYFMNGVLGPGETIPQQNWGDYPNAGLDLSGATKLTFFAKGSKGDERVEFFCMGVGWNPDRTVKEKPYPDRSPKLSTGPVLLHKEWTLYTIEVTGLDLSYVLGGFGWTATSGLIPNDNFQDITFFIDDIQYDKARLNEPRFIKSFRTIRSTNPVDQVMANAAFVYDNAVALIAFLAAGDIDHAKLIADAIVYAQEHDPVYKDGRLRIAYQAGDLKLPPGWFPSDTQAPVRTSGFTNPQGLFSQDEFQQSTHAGDLAWATLALLAYHRADSRDPKYLMAARRIGDWIIKNCWDDRGAGGFTAGFDGFPSNLKQLTYKATEHNIDLYAVYSQLFEFTQLDTYRLAAEHARAFFTDPSIFDSVGGKFWTGTGADGETVSTDPIPVDIQAWALLSLRDGNGPFRSSLQFAELNHRAKRGYDFDQDGDGVWFEGTGQMAVAYFHTCQRKKSYAITNFIAGRQDPSGGIFAASKDGLRTGFTLNDGSPWLYFKRLHIAPTGWFVLADRAINPFYGALGPNPLMANASLAQGVLRIQGNAFCDVSAVIINNADKTELVADHGENDIELKGAMDQLGLRSGSNTVQVIDLYGGASNVFTFAL